MLYINSPGGVVTAGMAIYDTMQFIKPTSRPLHRPGGVGRGGAVAAGTKGKRFSLPNSRILIHQPGCRAWAVRRPISIHARELLRTRERLNQILAHAHGPDAEAHPGRY